jgi:hypothetical protein
VSSLERRCRRLLRAYPARYRRERGEEMLGTLLEASPPGRTWPSWRDTRELVTGGLRARGWTWLASMLWAAAGVAGTGYTFYVTTQPYHPDLGFPGWSTDPLAVKIALVLVLLAWAACEALPVPLLVAGLVRLRGWRRGNWLRAAAWASACSAGVALYALSAVWGQYPCGPQGLSCPYDSPPVVSWGQLPICAAWLVLGAMMTCILARPARRSHVLNPASPAGREASRWPPGTGHLQT